MGSSLRRRRVALSLTWIALAAGAVVQLTLPLAPRSATDGTWALFAPARACLAAWTDAPTFYPLAAAIQVVSIGLALDVAAGLLAPRRPAGDADALRPWKALALLAFGTVTAGSIALLPAELQQGFAEPPWAARQRQEVEESIVTSLENARLGPDGARRIVLLGDSLSGGAFHVGVHMNPLIAAETGFPVRFLRLSGASWDLVALTEHFDTILELEPDLLILQANMLFKKAREIHVERRTRSRVARWSSRLARAFAWTCERLSIEGPGATADDLAALDLAPLGADRIEDRQVWRWRFRRATPHDRHLALARELLRRARARGVRLAIVVLPLTERVRQVAHAFLVDRLDYARRVAAEHGATLLAGEPTWPDELFQDGVHLNAAGKQRYSTEIAPRLAELLR